MPSIVFCLFHFIYASFFHSNFLFSTFSIPIACTLAHTCTHTCDSLGILYRAIRTGYCNHIYGINNGTKMAIAFVHGSRSTCKSIQYRHPHILNAFDAKSQSIANKHTQPIHHGSYVSSLTAPVFSLHRQLERSATNQHFFPALARIKIKHDDFQ